MGKSKKSIKAETNTDSKEESAKIQRMHRKNDGSISHHDWNIPNPKMRNIDFLKTLKDPFERREFLWEIFGGNLYYGEYNYDDLYMALRYPIGYEMEFWLASSLERRDVIYFKDRLWYVLGYYEDPETHQGHLGLLAKNPIMTAKFDDRPNGIFWGYSKLFQTLNSKALDHRDRSTIYYPSINIPDNWLDDIIVRRNSSEGSDFPVIEPQTLMADNGDVALQDYFHYGDPPPVANTISNDSDEIKAKIQIFGEYTHILSNFDNQTYTEKFDRYFLPTVPCWTLTPVSYNNVYVGTNTKEVANVKATYAESQDPLKNENYKFIENQVMVLNPDGSFSAQNVTSTAGVRPFISLNLSEIPASETFVLMPGHMAPNNYKKKIQSAKENWVNNKNEIFYTEPTWKDWRITNINMSNFDFLLNLPYDQEEKGDYADLYNDDLRRFLFELQRFSNTDNNEKVNSYGPYWDYDMWDYILSQQIGWESNFSQYDEWVPGTTFSYQNKIWTYLLDYGGLVEGMVNGRYGHNVMSKRFKSSTTRHKSGLKSNKMKSIMTNIINDIDNHNADKNILPGSFFEINDYEFTFPAPFAWVPGSDGSKAFDGHDSDYAGDCAILESGEMCPGWFSEIGDSAYGLIKFKVPAKDPSDVAIHFRLGDPVQNPQQNDDYGHFDSTKTMKAFQLYYSVVDEEGEVYTYPVGDVVYVDELTPTDYGVVQTETPSGSYTYAYEYHISCADIGTTISNITFYLAIVEPMTIEGLQSICVRDIDAKLVYSYFAGYNVFVSSRDAISTSKFGNESSDWNDCSFRKKINDVVFRKNTDGTQGEAYYPFLNIDQKYLQDIYINVITIIKQLMSFGAYGVDDFIDDLTTDPQTLIRLLFTSLTLLASNGDISPSIKKICNSIVELLPEFMQIKEDLERGIITEETAIRRFKELIRNVSIIPEFLSDKITIHSEILFILRNLLNNIFEYAELIMPLIIMYKRSNSTSIIPEELEVLRYTCRPSAWPDKDCWTLTAASFDENVNKVNVATTKNYFEPAHISESSGVAVVVDMNFVELNANGEYCRILPGRYTPDEYYVENNKNKEVK